MAFPDKPLTIDLDQVGLDAWIEFAEVGGKLESLSGGRNLSAMAEALSGARTILIALLSASDWTAADVGALNLSEMKQVFRSIGSGMHGPNASSGSPSTPPTPTAGRSPSAPGSAASRTNGAVRRGKLRPSSA